MKSLWHEMLFWGSAAWIVFLAAIRLANLLVAVAVLAPLAMFHELGGVRMFSFFLAHFFIGVDEGIEAHAEMVGWKMK